MSKAGAKLKVKGARLNLSQLAISEQVTIKRKSGGGAKKVKQHIDVSIFRRADLFSGKTRKIKKGVAKDAIALVSAAYQSALTGIAHSQDKRSQSDRKVGGSMVWPGPRGRSKPSNITMRTSWGQRLAGEGGSVPDSPMTFKGYTSATLRRYHLFRQYLFAVSGFRRYLRQPEPGQGDHTLSKRTRTKYAFEARNPALAPGTTSKVLQRMLGSRSPAVAAAARIGLAGELTSAKIGKNGRLPVRFRQVRLPGFADKQAVPIATLSGKVTGFDKAVNGFAQGEAMFVIPFLTGRTPTLSNRILFPGSAGPEQTAAIVTKNELERPYIREFMAGMHKRMIKYVAKNLRR